MTIKQASLHVEFFFLRRFCSCLVCRRRLTSCGLTRSTLVAFRLGIRYYYITSLVFFRSFNLIYTLEKKKKEILKTDIVSGYSMTMKFKSKLTNTQCTCQTERFALVGDAFLLHHWPESVNLSGGMRRLRVRSSPQ